MELPKCDMTGCSSGLPATLAPVLLIYAPVKYRHAPVRSSITLNVCVPCSKTITVESIVTDDGWARITAGFFKCGLILPERSLTKIAFESLAHRDSQFDAMTKAYPTKVVNA